MRRGGPNGPPRLFLFFLLCFLLFILLCVLFLNWSVNFHTINIFLFFFYYFFLFFL